MQPQKIAIIAGNGSLPHTLAHKITHDGGQVFIVAFEGQTAPETVQGVDPIWMRLRATKKIIDALKARDIQDLVMIGALRRPSLKELKPDLKTLEFFSKYALRLTGDDGLLQALKEFLEQEEGFRLHGFHKFMPEMLAPAGILGKAKPTPAEHADISKGLEVLRAIAPFDIGQAVIVQQGFVLGIEGAEGTDELLKRCGALKRAGSGAVLVKYCKTQQDRDLDMPTIGPETVENALDAGICGIAIQAGSTLIADIERVIRIADSHKIFIIGIDGN